MPRFTGQCHCGALQFTFTTAKTPAELPLRACACSFCRRHGTRTTSDPQGSVRFTLRDPAALCRYEFGLRTAAYLICRTCGTYIAAVAPGENGDHALVNVNCFDDQSGFDREPVVMNYDGEAEVARRQRRKDGWTPAVWDTEPPR
jgi:hypothetical protein